MECRLDGRTALVTGGSKGLGLAIAMEFARSGANLALVARNEADLELICERYDMPPLADSMFDLTRPKFGQTITRDEWKSEFDKGNNITV